MECFHARNSAIKGTIHEQDQSPILDQVLSKIQKCLVDFKVSKINDKLLGKCYMGLKYMKLPPLLIELNVMYSNSFDF